MSKYIINGGNTLDGIVEVQGAKNSVLPLLAGSILTDEKVILHNCPKISDVENMMRILISLGCKIKVEGNSVTVDSSCIMSGEIEHELAGELRSSIFLLGSILSRVGKARVAYPGGCDIGMRPIDIHLKGLRALNVSVREEGGMIFCDASNMKPAEILLDLPSVGATENIMMCAVGIKGKTIIRNPAKEPEIVDLQNLLNSMGAKIRGAGGSMIVIEGVKKLKGCHHTPISDRIVSGTLLIASAMCGGQLELRNVVAEHNFALISKLSKSTCKIINKNDTIYIKSKGRPSSFDSVETMYYPGFPTDLQSQMLALATISKGTSIIVENIFETRFKPVPELMKMGADITVKSTAAIIRGVNKLNGAEVKAEDLRGGASLVLAGLVANGITVVNDIYHIDRGYDNFEKVLKNIGADITRTD